MKTFQHWFRSQARRLTLSQGNAGFPLGGQTPSDRDYARISHDLQAVQQHQDNAHTGKPWKKVR
ncbi:hypothetical protein FHU41_002915 [Psychromicrobium silvestre]|uniref:Uncharacterized protein n=1 Tax=Psychromicrobium silvestre TaxID=1645614 RepID=A0A7Y9S8Q7_9MICC|nr:hypothetical protein [Psychromicrobium silvestre]NYE96665.1 hypothetical protein [Psychromicrobium silvestre]